MNIETSTINPATVFSKLINQDVIIALLVIGIIAFGLICYYFFRRRKETSIPTDQRSDVEVTQIEKNVIGNNNRVVKLPISPRIKIERRPIKKHAQLETQKPKPITVQYPRQDILLQIPKKEIVKPDEEEYSREKYIGYNPINIFAQTEPLNYPYVIMPIPDSVIKFPRKGRNGRKGYKEEEFKTYVEKHFNSDFQIYNDRFVLTKNSPKPYEPDFTLIDEKSGINIFLDIEIDEPYEGSNDIQKRKPTHFQYADTNRNNAFKNRGWIVIRFAEIQVHQEPDSCCRFIADVLKSIDPTYVIYDQLTKCSKIQEVKQWTKEEAMQWSIGKYREKYLGIDHFGLIADDEGLTKVDETELGNKVEEQIVDDKFIQNQEPANIPNLKLETIYSSIYTSRYLSFSFGSEKTIINPKTANEIELTGFCYVKNKLRTFQINQIKELQVKENYYTLRVAGPTIGLEQITNAISTSINYHKLIRMKYTRSAWNNMSVDEETGELIINNIEAEESTRTIQNIQLSIDALTPEDIKAYNLNSNYITAYCNKREEQRTFRFDRIGEVEILDL